MRARIGWILMAAVVAPMWHPFPAAAQSPDAFAGWVGLVSTPVGGLIPEAPGLPASEWSVRARWGHWQFDDDDDNTTNLALGLGFPIGAAGGTVEVGRRTVRGCDDCDGLLLGLEALIPLLETPLNENGTVLGVSLHPAAGYMREVGDSDLSTFALAVRVPGHVRADVGESVRLVPFLSPGVGLGRISAENDSESGLRFLVAGGLGLEISPRVRATAGFNRIFIEHGETVIGASVGVGF